LTLLSLTTKHLYISIATDHCGGISTTSTNSFSANKKAKKRGKVISKKRQVAFPKKADCSSDGLTKMKSQKG
jgi:hypothetical protein